MKPRFIGRKRVFALTLIFSHLVGLAVAQAAPKADLWPRWRTHDKTSSRVVDHGTWAAFLKKYLVFPHASGINRMRYGAVHQEDRARLKSYLKELQSLPISTYNRAEQKAYWINFYNALTVDVILNHFPVNSIRDIDISPGWFSNGPWGAKLVAVEGEKLSLDDIEHRILRPIWNDNRIHYAVNCASLGCPNLQPSAFTAANTESLLENGAREYINHPRGVSIADGDLKVSSIYVWFQEDFGGSVDGLMAHWTKYASPALAKALLSYKGGRLDHDYDWRMNGAGVEVAQPR